MNLSENIKRLMHTHGNLSVSELAKLTHIPQPTLHHILTGSTKNPRKKALEILATFFSVSIAQLTGEKPLKNNIPENIKNSFKLKSIPIITWDILKKWPELSAQGIDLKEIILHQEVHDQSFAIVMEDSQLEPLFSINNLLLFDSGRTPKDRDIVIVRDNINNNILCNRLFIDNNEYYIKQNLENGNVQLIKLNKQIHQIISVLIEVRIQY